MQAFGGIARTHTGRIETLQQPECRAQFVGIDLRLSGTQRQEFFERVLQIAIVVERLDQQIDQRAITCARLRAGQLTPKMLPQARAGPGPVDGGGFVVIGTRLVAAPLERRFRRPITAVRGRRCIGLCLAAGGGRRLSDRAIGTQMQRSRLWIVVALEQWIVCHRLVDFLIQLQGRQLQQPDRLL